MHSLPVRALLWSIERESNSSFVSEVGAGNSMTSILVWVRQPRSLRNSSLNKTQREIAIWKQTMLHAQICENSQTFFFFFAKPESQMFTIVAREELVIDSLSFA